MWLLGIDKLAQSSAVVVASSSLDIIKHLDMCNTDWRPPHERCESEDCVEKTHAEAIDSSTPSLKLESEHGDKYAGTQHEEISHCQRVATH